MKKMFSLTFLFFSLFFFTNKNLRSLEFILEHLSAVGTFERKNLTLNDHKLEKLCITLAEKIFPIVKIESDKLFLIERFILSKSLVLRYCSEKVYLFNFDFSAAAKLLAEISNYSFDSNDLATSVKDEIQALPNQALPNQALPNSDEMNLGLRERIIEKVIDENFLGKLIDKMNELTELKEFGEQQVCIISKESQWLPKFFYVMGLQGCFYTSSLIALALPKIIEFHRLQLIRSLSHPVRAIELRRRVRNNIKSLLDSSTFLSEPKADFFYESINYLVPDDSSLKRFCIDFFIKNNIAIEPEVLALL